MTATQLRVETNIGQEIAQISEDFARPIEVVREALHNAYDAQAKDVSIRAQVETLADGRRALSLEFADNGMGMSPDVLAKFFGLGWSEKPSRELRTPIGFKGHGTKIYYQARDVHVVTSRSDGSVSYAVVRNARESVFNKRPPEPLLFINGEARKQIDLAHLTVPSHSGTLVRLVDFTADSNRLIDVFRFDSLANYLRWFTVFGSFEHITRQNRRPTPLLNLRVTGSDNKTGDISFGHDWPIDDQVSLAALKKLDERRPYNYFRKTFRFPSYSAPGGFNLDAAILFEGRRGRLDRDANISRQGRKGLYAEEERYGLWLCRDFFPIEQKTEWLMDEKCPATIEMIGRPLMLVNSQDFRLIANRGSVGNSNPQLLESVQQAVYQMIETAMEDRDLSRFLNEYQDDLLGRRREKDKKALHRRIARYNEKQWMTVALPKSGEFEFWEPKSEITLFGLVAELQRVEPGLLGFEILDFDAHSGIDMLVRKNGTGDPGEKRQRVYYVELKFELGSQVNHAFDHLSGIICWDTILKPDDPVIDAAGQQFLFQELTDKHGVTHSHLVHHPDSNFDHTVRVVVLRRLLTERYALAHQKNPRPVKY